MNNVWKVGIVIIALFQIIFMAMQTHKQSEEARGKLCQDSIVEQLVIYQSEITRLHENDSIQNYSIEQIIIAIDSLIRYNEAHELKLPADTTGIR